ncbi:DUF2141 domain-containing protein [Novosphingobium resinovorum]|uniref:DUF2141 domain-containing protein n=1 Tax=Novosphingobium sp. HR1a TaxID=1395637 RepID=UPI001B3C8DFF|nr:MULTISPECIES: DUF2141 domain-containing protein [Novosphingobium]MBF7013210.1 DUF2141 domain-containing protein [Novosphingobium sp. HR1a]WJM27936.1 DUF2141 domain-containing protein [Novosphingobium resinovorum]
MLAGATAPQNTDVSVSVTDMRSAKGQVLACLTTRPDAFPDCEKDPQARKLTVPAASDLHLDFGAVPQGRYAVSLIHDENGNGKLDTRLMIPREGYGFSRDAPVRMGPPKFAQAAFEVGGEPVRLAIRMRYLL